MSSGDHADCVFCTIEQTQPELVVWSTPEVVAFFDINPLVASDAHVLVVPRHHFRTLVDVPPPTARALGESLPIVARALLAETGATDFNVVQNNGVRAGQVVHHVHFHIVIRGKEVQTVDDALLQRVRQQFSARERLALASTLFGKGQREDLGDVSGLTVRLRSRLSKL